MTVTSDVQDTTYITDGSTVDFPIPFYFLDPRHVAVDKIGTNGSIDPLVLGTDFTVSGAGNANGGLLHTLSTVPHGFTLHAYRLVPVTQESEYLQNDPFPSKTTELALDKLTMIAQQNSAAVKNSIRYPLTEYSKDGTLPPPGDRALKVLGFDAIGGQTLLPLPASIGAGDLRNEFWKDGTDYTAGTSTFVTLSRQYLTKANIGTVMMGGIGQAPDTYRINGLRLEFLDDNGELTAIPEFVNKIWCVGGTTLSLNAPALESVNDAMLAPGSKVDNRAQLQLAVRDFPMLSGSYQDDTSAVEDALNLALETGRPIEFPFDRDVYITRPIDLMPKSANSTWTGIVGIHTSRANGILLRGQGGRAIKAAPNFSGGDYMLRFIYDGVNNWIAPQWSALEDLILDGSGIVSKGLISNYCMNVQLRRIRATGVSTAFKWIGYGVAAIDRCTAFADVCVDVTEGGGDSWITKCDFYPTSRGVLVGPSGGNLTVDSSVFTRQDADFPLGATPIAVASTLSASELRDVRVRNCEFSGMQFGVSLAGTVADSVKRIVIEGCHTTPSAGGALWSGALAHLENTREATIRGNFIGFPGNRTVASPAVPGIGLIGCNNVSMSDNQYSYLNASALVATNCVGLTHVGNRVNNAAMTDGTGTAIYLENVTDSLIDSNLGQKTEATAGSTFISEIGSSTRNKGSNLVSGFTTYASLAPGSTSSYT
ncbi:right-handed parallel beta-helix repeat-containing protein [Burkholderia vietnamiensis]|uniref:right-handed parallel beta-helix repeat-containing protein n=1 Tax=Burkholderia vietnamiensis TaxID=60552 RepID=UPI00264BF294|nr:right-handed parallel beta-helix repeat-containing protein [Burkholderia vietnamiensis]MDN8068822.1 right-handed parallel beta-helix repeat-containing protein [Burkholderia vietnamiensis]